MLSCLLWLWYAAPPAQRIDAIIINHCIIGAATIKNTDIVRLRPFGPEGALLGRARRFW
jgi:hypothetical protein